MRALQEFHLDPNGKTCLDIGAAHGGFTDCLLQHGAAKVYAVDVAYGILDWKLRQDPRVVVIERTNARYYKSDQKFDLATIDVSFISLSKIFPAVYDLLQEHGEVVALIKPQFEAKKADVPRGGVIRDESVRQAVIERVKTAAAETGFQVNRVIPSPIEGADGNVEYFIHLSK